MNELESSPKTWPPLGLPTGSVRALLTLIVVAVVVTTLLEAANVRIERLITHGHASPPGF